MSVSNFWQLPDPLPDGEQFDRLLETPDFFLERIISRGQVTPAGQWYDQVADEWVMLLQGEAILTYDDGQVYHLRQGDYLLIPAHQRHRVTFTTVDPPCLWLAIHGSLRESKGNDV